MPRCRAVEAHAAPYPEPLCGRADDPVAVGRRDPDAPDWLWCRHAVTGREGWVPEALLRPGPMPGLAALGEDYDARELDVAAGDVLEAGASAAGWTWCLAAAGRAGWVPDGKLTP